jgi:outer membrane protein assembly factor BamB
MRRIARVAALAAAALVVGACWPVPGQNADRTANNGAERRLTVDTVAGLQEAWTFTSGGVAMLDPVLSPGGVHATLDACGVITLDPATGHQRWFRDVSNCQGGAFSPVRENTAPWVVGDEVLFGYAWALDSTPSDRWGWATEALDAATGDLVRSDTAAVVAAARGTEGVLGVPSVNATGGPPYQFQSFGPPALLEVGPFADPAGRRVIHVATRADGPVFESGTATRGASAVFHAGTGIMTTEPAAVLAAGRAVRAFSATEARPGCAVATPGSGGTIKVSVECPLWVRPVDTTVTTAPVVDSRRSTLFVGTQGGTVLALDTATGTVRWSAALGAAVSATPALAGDTLLVPVAGGRLVALAAAGCGAATCAPGWSAATGGDVGVQPAVAGGVVYTGSASGSVRAFAAAGCGAATCPALWSDTAPGEVTGAPAVSNGQLYVGTSAGMSAYGL